jgi:hypothetical protein
MGRGHRDKMKTFEVEIKEIKTYHIKIEAEDETDAILEGHDVDLDDEEPTWCGREVVTAAELEEQRR